MEDQRLNFSKYEEKFFNFDQRTYEEKLFQEKEIEKLSKQNRELFSCTKLSKKPKTQGSFPHLIKTLKFPDGWYVKYTDNLDSHSHFRYKTPVFTIHGCPGSYQDWLGLENSIGSNQFRIINFFVPGFDNDREDDRGDYSGSMEDVGLLIVRLLDHLAIRRVIFLIHSMGGYLMFYFCQKFQEKVAGLIYMAAPSINWYVGFVVFYGIMGAMSHMNRQIGEVVLLKNEKFRKVLLHFLRKKVADITLEGVKFPNLSENELCAFIKLFTSVKDISNIYSYSKQMPKVLKFLACGKNDPINEFDKFIECFYYNVFGEGKMREDEFSEEIKINIRRKVNEIEEFKNLEINFSKLQSNFVFTFEKTGHNVHRKRCQELSKPLRCYVAIIDATEEVLLKIINPKL